MDPFRKALAKLAVAGKRKGFVTFTQARAVLDEAGAGGDGLHRLLEVLEDAGILLEDGDDEPAQPPAPRKAQANSLSLRT